jgi:hypothetical protein
MPRVDDPDLAKNAFNLYRVEIVAVTRGGASMARCGAIFWPEGTAKLDDLKEAASEFAAAKEAAKIRTKKPKDKTKKDKGDKGDRPADAKE